MKLGFALSLCSLLLNPAKQGLPSITPQTANNHRSAPPIHITKIVVKAVELGSTTWGRIDCATFDQHFPNANTIIVIDQSTLEVFARRIALFKPAEEKYNVDARAKMTIYYSDNTIASLCIGGIMEFNGKKVKYDPDILMLLGIRDF